MTRCRALRIGGRATAVCIVAGVAAMAFALPAAGQRDRPWATCAGLRLAHISLQRRPHGGDPADQPELHKRADPDCRVDGVDEWQRRQLDRGGAQSDQQRRDRLRGRCCRRDARLQSRHRCPAVVVPGHWDRPRHLRIPAVYDGVVYFGTGNGTLYALDATTGALDCSYVVASKIQSSPVVVTDADGSGPIIYQGYLLPRAVNGRSTEWATPTARAPGLVHGQRWGTFIQHVVLGCIRH